MGSRRGLYRLLSYGYAVASVAPLCCGRGIACGFRVCDQCCSNPDGPGVLVAPHIQGAVSEHGTVWGVVSSVSSQGTRAPGREGLGRGEGSSHLGTGLLAGWPILLGVTGVPAALQLLLLPFFPESPRYLLIQKKDEVAAQTGKAPPCRGRRPRRLCSGKLGSPEPAPCSPPLALKRLRGWDDVNPEMEEIRQEDEAERAVGFVSVLKMFRTRSLRWQVISVIVLMGGQQLSGVNAVRGLGGGGWAGR